MSQNSVSRFCSSLISDHVFKQLVPLNDHKHDISKRFVSLIYLLVRNVNQIITRIQLSKISPSSIGKGAAERCPNKATRQRKIFKVLEFILASSLLRDDIRGTIISCTPARSNL